MDICEAWTSSTSSRASAPPDDEWADFDHFAAQRVSHSTDAVMKDGNEMMEIKTTETAEQTTTEPPEAVSTSSLPEPQGISGVETQGISSVETQGISSIETQGISSVDPQAQTQEVEKLKNE